MAKCVGIDLGTTFSVVSYVDDKGVAKVISLHDGQNTLPSAVFFKDGKTVVGEQAKEKGPSNPANYAEFMKRHMGEKFIFKTDCGDEYRPEDISAMVLKKIIQDAEEKLGDKIAEAVITVPAYFSDIQRNATKDAAKIAGINCLGLVNEPTAAAIAYKLDKNVKDRQLIMVYDLGGGTFDVTILEIQNNEINVLATCGDPKLGGYDFDRCICDYVVGKVKEDKKIDIESDPRAKQSLMMAAEKAKIALSNAEETELNIYFRGELVEVSLTREKFEELIEMKLDSSVSIMQNAMDESKKNYEDLDKIILVGGSTKIPCVSRIILEESGIKPSSEVHPDEAVSIGAAYYAMDLAIKNAKNQKNTGNDDRGSNDVEVVKENPEFKFRDVTSHGFGIACENMETHEMMNSVIIPANSKIPCEFKKTYGTTRDYQEQIRVTVTSGEDEDLDYVTVIGEAVMNLKPKKGLYPIGVMISCDESGMLHVVAYDLQEKIQLGDMKISRGEYSMTDEQIKKSSSKLQALNIG